MTTNIAGHEGIGRVVGMGHDVPPSFHDKRVGIKWLYNYCNECEICSEAIMNCPTQLNTGKDVPGTFQQYLVSPSEPLTLNPDALQSTVAAPLLCAGLTMYSAIKKMRLKPGQWLAMIGAGGGLGHLGVQIAKRRGLRVIAIDTGEERRSLCLELGASIFLDYMTEDVPGSVMRITQGYGAHGAICLTSSRAGYAQSLGLLRNLGTLVCLGVAMDDLPISPLQMIVRGIQIMGSSVGSHEDLAELLEMAAAKLVEPVVKTFNFTELNDVLNQVKHNRISGRAVVMIPQ